MRNASAAAPVWMSAASRGFGELKAARRKEPYGHLYDQQQETAGKAGSDHPGSRPGGRREDPHALPYQGRVSQRRLQDVRRGGQGQAQSHPLVRVPGGGGHGDPDTEPPCHQRPPDHHRASPGKPSIRLSHLPEERILRAAVPGLGVRNRPGAIPGKDPAPLHGLLLPFDHQGAGQVHPLRTMRENLRRDPGRRGHRLHPSRASTPWFFLRSRWT